MAIPKSSDPEDRGSVVAQYQVFWNSVSPRRVVILQFPNRSHSQPYNKAHNLKPQKIRFKPISGVVEIDVPLDTQAKGHFDRQKAMDFGAQIKRNKIIQAGGSFGIAGGFGVGGVTARGGRRAAGANGSDVKDGVGYGGLNIDKEYDQAEREGGVLKTLTLSGKIQSFREGDPIIAMASFKGEELHLTRVDAICSMSPQYTHLDAAVDNEKISRLSTTETGGAESAEARAVNVAVRAGDSDHVPQDEIGKTLRAMQEEPWQNMEWIDEEDDQAYFSFQNHLFYTEDSVGERLVSNMNPVTYLDSISAPKVDDLVVGQKIVQQHRDNVAEDLDVSTDDSDSDEEVMQEEGLKRQVAVD